MYGDYMTTAETAKFLKVSPSLVKKWRNKGWLMPDAIGHDRNGRGKAYYYSKERILQLAGVWLTKPESSEHGTNLSGHTSGTPRTATELQPDTDETQSRIDEATKFLKLLFGKISEPHFSYLAKFKGITEFFPFTINDQTQIQAMARKAIELSDMGIDIWHAVNPVCITPTPSKRGDETAVSYQTACVVDIDIKSDAHKNENLATSFDEAKSFLPFTPSIIINSGFGLHAYYLFDEPILITDQNREEIKRRNQLFIDVVRFRANGKKIDGVGDLPRILRTPGTFNYKLGIDNAPLCHIVEDSSLRFSPTELNVKLNALIPPTTATTHQPRPATENFDFIEDTDFDRFRVRRMLDFISPVSLTYDEWLAVGMALKNIGCDCSDWEQWSRPDERFKEGECEKKWDGFDRDGYDIGTISYFAQQKGYDPKEAYREWKELHADSKSTPHKTKPITQLDKLKAELNTINKSLADFDSEQKTAIEKIYSLEKFDSGTMFAKETITAAAFASLADKQAFSNLKRSVKLYGERHPTEKVALLDWQASIRDKANELSSRKNELLNRRNQINAQIRSQAFLATDDTLAGIVIPNGYCISADNGVEKVSGEKLVTICRRPVIIDAKTYCVDEKIFKVNLAYKSPTGKWKHSDPVEKAIVFNHRKLVDLANSDLPVTSQNAAALVEYFDAFCSANEINFPLEYSVSRGGWYKFHGKEDFVDPRRNFFVTDEDGTKISVKVNKQSEFASGLNQEGTLDEWHTGAYALAKKSPVARLIVSAAVAPPLLKILGERNFMVYVVAPTRAGKTTALYLGASAIGSEKMIRSFDATKNGLIGAAADVSDYAFLVDEKQVADNRIKEQLSNLVYAFGNGIGRTKLNKDSTLRKLQDWRIIAIATGETQLLPDNVTEGANTRLLTINAPKVILSPADCRQIRNIVSENYGHVFPLVIDKIVAIGKEKLRETYERLVDKFIAENPNLLPEYCRYMAVLTLADALLNSVLGEARAFDDALKAAQAIFPLIPTTTDISDTARERDFVLGFIAQNQSRFIGGNVSLDRMQTIYGKLDSPDYFYITVTALKQACIDAGFDHKKLVSDLVAEGFIKPADTVEKGRRTPRNTVPQRIGSGSVPPVPCYRIPKKY